MTYTGNNKKIFDQMFKKRKGKKKMPDYLMVNQ